MEDIEDATVLPSNWQKILSVRRNKTCLIKYLSKAFLHHSQQYLQSFQVLIVSGVNDDAFCVSQSGIQQAHHLSGHHDEADTRIFFHVENTIHKNIQIYSKDTDVPHIGLICQPDHKNIVI